MRESKGSEATPSGWRPGKADPQARPGTGRQGLGGLGGPTAPSMIFRKGAARRSPLGDRSGYPARSPAACSGSDKSAPPWPDLKAMGGSTGLGQGKDAPPWRCPARPSGHQRRRPALPRGSQPCLAVCRRFFVIAATIFHHEGRIGNRLFRRACSWREGKAFFKWPSWSPSGHRRTLRNEPPTPAGRHLEVKGVTHADSLYSLRSAVWSPA